MEKDAIQSKEKFPNTWGNAFPKSKVEIPSQNKRNIKIIEQTHSQINSTHNRSHFFKIKIPPNETTAQVDAPKWQLQLPGISPRALFLVILLLRCTGVEAGSTSDTFIHTGAKIATPILTVICLNVGRALKTDGYNKLCALGKQLKQQDVDIAIITEVGPYKTHLMNQNLHRETPQYTVLGQYTENKDTPSEGGIAIIIKTAMLANISNNSTKTLLNNRLIHTQINRYKEQTLHIIGVYAPATQPKGPQQQEIQDYINRLEDIRHPTENSRGEPKHLYILGGDMNDITYAHDTTNKARKPAKTSIPQMLTEDTQLLDTFRLMHRTKKGYTHKYHNGVEEARIDMLFVSPIFTEENNMWSAGIDDTNTLFEDSTTDHHTIFCQLANTKYKVKKGTKRQSKSTPSEAQTLRRRVNKMADQQWEVFRQELNRKTQTQTDLQNAKALYNDSKQAQTIVTEIQQRLDKIYTSTIANILETLKKQDAQTEIKTQRSKQTKLAPTREEREEKKQLKQLQSIFKLTKALEAMHYTAENNDRRKYIYSEASRRITIFRLRFTENKNRPLADLRIKEDNQECGKWREWNNKLEEQIHTTQRQVTKLTNIRLRKDTDMWLNMRHNKNLEEGIHTANKTFKDFQPSVQIQTVWSTERSTRTMQICRDTACTIVDRRCEVCGAEAYVTDNIEEIKQQTKKWAQDKFTGTNTHYDKLFTYAQDTEGRKTTTRKANPEWETVEERHRFMWHLTQPAAQATQDHYKHIMDDAEEEEWREYINTRKGKSAPGPTMFSYRMLKNCPPDILTTLRHINNTMLRIKRMSPTLKAAAVTLLAKSSGPVALPNVRPITLLEIGYKLLTGLVTHRINELSKTAPEPLVNETQFGGTQNRSAQDSLEIWTTILEDAVTTNSPLYAIYADVKAAYDSIHTETKQLMYQAAGLPLALSELQGDLDIENDTVVLLHNQGQTTSFKPEKGLRQGDPLSVLAWILFVNPLLKWLQYGIPNAGPITYQPHPIQAQHNGGGTRRDDTPAKGVRVGQAERGVTNLMYMDDAEYPSASKADCIMIAERTSRYFVMHNTDTHEGKTKFTNNQGDKEAPAVQTMGGWKTIAVVPPTAAIKHLGVYFTLTLNWEKQKEEVYTLLHKFKYTLFTKKGNLQECINVTETIIHPTILYKIQTTPLAGTEINRIEATITKLLQSSARMSKTAAYWKWYAPIENGGLGRTRLRQKLVEQSLLQTITTLNKTTDNIVRQHLIAKIANARRQSATETATCFRAPGERHTQVTKKITKQYAFQALTQMWQEAGIQLTDRNDELTEYNTEGQTSTPLHTVLTKEQWISIKGNLSEWAISRVEELLAKDKKTIAKWEIKMHKGENTSAPKWYKALTKWLTEAHTGQIRPNTLQNLPEIQEILVDMKIPQIPQGIPTESMTNEDGSKTPTVTIISDGSYYKETPSRRASAAAATIWITKGEQIYIKEEELTQQQASHNVQYAWTLQHPAIFDSTSAELGGTILGMIMTLNQQSKTHHYLDNTGVIATLTGNNKKRTIRKEYKNNYGQLLRAATYLLQQKEQQWDYNMKWIKGHEGLTYNEMVDQLAKAAHDDTYITTIPQITPKQVNIDHFMEQMEPHFWIKYTPYTIITTGLRMAITTRPGEAITTTTPRGIASMVKQIFKQENAAAYKLSSTKYQPLGFMQQGDQKTLTRAIKGHITSKSNRHTWTQAIQLYTNTVSSMYYLLKTNKPWRKHIIIIGKEDKLDERSGWTTLPQAIQHYQVYCPACAHTPASQEEYYSNTTHILTTCTYAPSRKHIQEIQEEIIHLLSTLGPYQWWTNKDTRETNAIQWKAVERLPEGEKFNECWRPSIQQHYNKEEQHSVQLQPPDQQVAGPVHMTVRALYKLTTYMTNSTTPQTALYTLLQETQETEDILTLPAHIKQTLLEGAINTHTLDADVGSLCEVTHTHSTRAQIPKECQLSIQTDKEWQQKTTQSVLYYEGLTNTPKQHQRTREIVQQIKTNMQQGNMYLLVLSKDHKTMVQQLLQETGAQTWGVIKAYTLHLNRRQQRTGIEEHIRAQSNANTQNIYICAIHPRDHVSIMLTQRLRINGYATTFKFTRTPISQAEAKVINSKYNWYPNHVYTQEKQHRQSTLLSAHLIGKGVIPSTIRKLLTEVLKLNRSDTQRTLDQIMLIQQEGLHHALQQLNKAINRTLSAQLPEPEEISNRIAQPRGKKDTEPAPILDTTRCRGKCFGKQGNTGCNNTICTKRCGHIPPKYAQVCEECEQCQVNIAQYVAQVTQKITPEQLMHTHCQCAEYRKSISRYYKTAKMQNALQVIDIFSEHAKETQRQIIKMQQITQEENIVHRFFKAANQQGEQLVGRVIKKHFGSQLYKGKIIKYIKGMGLYAIKYADGDREEMSLPEVQCYIEPIKTKSQELLLTKRNPLELNYFVLQDPQVEEISQMMHNLRFGKIKRRHLINWDTPIQFSTITRVSRKRKDKPINISSNQQLSLENSPKEAIQNSYGQMKPGQSQSESENEDCAINTSSRKKIRTEPDTDIIKIQSSSRIIMPQGINKRKYSITDESTTSAFRDLGEEKPQSKRMAKRSRVTQELSQLDNETSVDAPTTQGVTVESRASTQTQYRQQQTEKVVPGILGVGAGSRTTPTPRLFDMFNRTGIG